MTASLIIYGIGTVAAAIWGGVGVAFLHELPDTIASDKNKRTAAHTLIYCWAWPILTIHGIAWLIRAARDTLNQ